MPSRFLAKNIEHDWGSSWGDDTTYANKQLQQALSQCNGPTPSKESDVCNASLSWMDQRRWGIEFALDALRQGDHEHPLLKPAEKALAELEPKLPEPESPGYVPMVNKKQNISLCDGQAVVALDDGGALSYVFTKQHNYQFASQSNLLAETIVHVASQEQRRAWASAYTDTKKVSIREKGPLLSSSVCMSLVPTVSNWSLARPSSTSRV